MRKQKQQEVKSNTEILRDVMARHDMGKDEIAAALHLSPSTVDSWLRPSGTKAFRRMPTGYRELLEMKYPL